MKEHFCPAEQSTITYQGECSWCGESEGGMTNIVKQPMLPDTIHFHHTMNNDNTEVMRITRDGVWVNPDMSIDDTAKAVLAALDSQIKVLVQSEREACAKVCDDWPNGRDDMYSIGVAIRARGQA